VQRTSSDDHLSDARDRETGAGAVRRALGNRWTLAVLGALIGAVVSAFFVSNPHFLPNIEAGAHHNPVTHVYEGLIVQPEGEWEYDAASLKRSRRARSLAYDAQVRVTAFCIGEPTYNFVTKVIDERWLILQDGHVIPAPSAISTLSLARTEPRPCPAAGGMIAGPQSISFHPKPSSPKLLLTATAPDATTVGFALFDRGASHWRSVALTLQKGHGFSARVPIGNAAVAMAVACWGARAPANPNGRLVFSLRPLYHGHSKVFENAAAQAPSGIARACAPTSYGAVKQARAPKRGARRPALIYSPTAAPQSTRIEPYSRPSAAPTHLDETVIHHEE
jgi:hypothetical protein